MRVVYSERVRPTPDIGVRKKRQLEASSRFEICYDMFQFFMDGRTYRCRVVSGGPVVPKILFLYMYMIRHSKDTILVLHVPDNIDDDDDDNEDDDVDDNND